MTSIGSETERRVQSYHPSLSVVGGVLLGVLLLGMPLLGASQERADEGFEDAGRGPAGKEWPLAGGDWGNTRYSALDQINSQTVARLGGAWTRRFEGGLASRQTPVIKDGRMFIAAAAEVYALDPKTGESIWTWWTNSPRTEVEDNSTVQNQRQVLFQGAVFAAPHGLATGAGLVFVGLTDGRIAALRQATGEFVWETQIGGDPRRQRGQTVTAPPMYARGVVYAGLANGDWGVMGRVVALDARTGEELWHFKVIPGPGEAGHDTWPAGSEIWRQGGGGVWNMGTVDVELGLVFFPTGNVTPVMGGEVRAGDNLYTNSIIALDMKTGSLRWHYQLVHHDLWDVDLATAPVLYDVQLDGELRRALAVLRPDGYWFLLDRVSGEPLTPVEERPVTQDPYLKTAPTQPFPVGGGRLVPECETWQPQVRSPFVVDCPGFAPPSLDRHNVLMPSVGFMRVIPPAYSPQTGFLYAQGTASLRRSRRITDDPWYWGSGGGSPVPLAPSFDVLAAVDGRSNTVVWKQDLPPGGGPLTTAGGLMFRAAADGAFEAFDARTGDRLWQFQLGRATRATPATYEIGDEQYVALAVGPELWAFKLDGPVPMRQARPRPPVGLVAEDTNVVETGALMAASENMGHRWALDEHTFSPNRIRVTAGTWVRFLNNGRMSHTMVAEDGAWQVGPLAPGQQDGALFDQPGTHTYYCSEHPWALGQVVVEP